MIMRSRGEEFRAPHRHMFLERHVLFSRYPQRVCMCVLYSLALCFKVRGDKGNAGAGATPKERTVPPIRPRPFVLPIWGILIETLGMYTGLINFEGVRAQRL